MTGYACCEHCYVKDGACVDLHPGYPAHKHPCPYDGCTVGGTQVPQEAAQEARGGPDAPGSASQDAQGGPAGHTGPIRAVCVHDDGSTHPGDGTLPCPFLAFTAGYDEETR